jgi:hypothetical protein
MGIGSGDTPALLASIFEALAWRQAPRATDGMRDGPQSAKADFVWWLQRIHSPVHGVAPR